MSSFTVNVAFSHDLRGGTEPAGPTVTLRVDAEGFHDAGGLGGGGQVVDVVAVDRVAELLKTEFPPDAVRAVLAHLAKLASIV